MRADRCLTASNPPVVNDELARKVADFYESAEHAPADEAVRASYDALRDETLQQLGAIEAAGYTIEPWTGAGEPYKSSADMTADINQNKHLYFKQTGTEMTPDNLMADFNDTFRAVHDFFGHAAEGYQFGPRGELAAWNAHSEMYSAEAQGALAAETLAQNSWVNFGKHLEGKNIPLPDRPFAEQKNVVVPAELIAEAKAQFQPKRKADKSLKFAGTKFNQISNAWILPDNTVKQIGSKWHHEWLDENKSVQEKYGLKIPPFEGGDIEATREKALKKGFVRANLSPSNGLLTVEAREKDWKRIRPVVEDLIEQNLDNVDRFRVNLFDDSVGRLIKSYGEKIFDLDSDKEKMDKVFETFAEQPQGEIGAQFQPKRAEQEQPNFRHNESVFKDESGFWIDSNGKLFPTPNHEQTARELLGMKPYSIEDEPPRLEASNQLSKKGWAQVVYDDGLGIVFIRGPRVTNAQKSELVRLAIEKELRLRQDLPSGRLVDLYTPPDQLQGELSPGEREETIYGFLKKSAFQPKRAEQEQLFGGRELLSSVELGKMTKAEIADHFPEAVIPAKRDEKIPSEITKSPLYKRAVNEESAVAAFADKLAEFANQYKDDPLFKSGSRWYSEFTPMLKREFGADAQLMAELLAATSPQTPPSTNFGYAFDALEGFRSGRFRKTIDKFNQGLDMLSEDRWLSWYNKELKAGRIPEPPAEPTDAAFLEHWIATHDLKPRQSNGKLYGQHSLPVLQVFVRRWLELNKGLKTRNFVENLTGESHEATIDLWADRTMRRLGYEGRERWRILPQNGTGVSDADFSFAQKAFRAAADKLGMKPDDLQGALWFAEKSLWADNGWGRIDLGDFRKEMEKLPLLRAGVQHRLATTEAGKKGGRAEETVIPLTKMQAQPKREETWTQMMNRVQMESARNANDPAYLGYKRTPLTQEQEQEWFDEELAAERKNKVVVEPRKLK